MVGGAQGKNVSDLLFPFSLSNNTMPTGLQDDYMKQTSVVQQRIAIFGDCWPEIEGVAYLLEKTGKGCHIETYHTADAFFHDIENHPADCIIITLPPRGYAYFLYQVSLRCPHTPIVVLAEKFYLSDRVVLETLTLSGLSFAALIGFQYDKIFGLFPIDSRHLRHYSKEEFIRYMNKKIFSALHTQGMTHAQREVLTLLARGYSNAKVSRLLKISNKTVSTHKQNGLMKLPQKKDRLALSQGLQVTCHMKLMP